MGLFFSNNRSVKGQFFIQFGVCFRFVFSVFGSVLYLAALDVRALKLSNLESFRALTAFNLATGTTGRLIKKSEIEIE